MPELIDGGAFRDDSIGGGLRFETDEIFYRTNHGYHWAVGIDPAAASALTVGEGIRAEELIEVGLGLAAATFGMSAAFGIAAKTVGSFASGFSRQILRSLTRSVQCDTLLSRLFLEAFTQAGIKTVVLTKPYSENGQEGWTESAYPAIPGEVHPFLVWQLVQQVRLVIEQKLAPALQRVRNDRTDMTNVIRAAESLRVFPLSATDTGRDYRILFKFNQKRKIYGKPGIASRWIRPTLPPRVDSRSFVSWFGGEDPTGDPSAGELAFSDVLLDRFPQVDWRRAQGEYAGFYRVIYPFHSDYSASYSISHYEANSIIQQWNQLGAYRRAIIQFSRYSAFFRYAMPSLAWMNLSINGRSIKYRYSQTDARWYYVDTTDRTAQYYYADSSQDPYVGISPEYNPFNQNHEEYSQQLFDQRSATYIKTAKPKGSVVLARQGDSVAPSEQDSNQALFTLLATAAAFFL